MGQAMIRNAEQRLDGNVHTNLLSSLANCALFKRLKKIQFAADNAPVTRFGWAIPQGQQHATLRVHQ